MWTLVNNSVNNFITSGSTQRYPGNNDNSQSDHVRILSFIDFIDPLTSSSLNYMLLVMSSREKSLESENPLKSEWILCLLFPSMIPKIHTGTENLHENPFQIQLSLVKSCAEDGHECFLCTLYCCKVSCRWGAAPSLGLFVLGTDAKYSHRRWWHFTETELQRRNIKVYSNGADGAWPFLKPMIINTSIKIRQW